MCDPHLIVYNGVFDFLANNDRAKKAVIVDMERE